MSPPSPESPLDVLATPERVDPGRWRVELPDRWQQGRGAFGGLLLAAMIRAIEAEMTDPARALRTLPIGGQSHLQLLLALGLIAAFIVGCPGVPTKPAGQPVASCEPKRAPDTRVRLVFDTGWSWWTDPDEECPQWSAALLLAKGMAGCSDDYVGDPAQKCQAAIRRCSPGCDVCANLKPGEGPDTIFGYLFQGAEGPTYATTGGPYLFGDFDTKFDKAEACGDKVKLAKVMIHETTHACTAAGGEKKLYDSYDFWHQGIPGCFADEVAPFEGSRECGDK